MLLRLGKKGQTTAEYAIMLALIIGAVIAMQHYVGRGLKGGTKFTVDKLQKEEGTAQYEPYYMESEFTTTRKNVRMAEETLEGGGVVREIADEDAQETTQRWGYQEIRGTE